MDISLVKDSLTSFLDEGILNCSLCKLSNYSVNKDQGKLLGFGKVGKVVLLSLCPSYKRSSSRYNWMQDLRSSESCDLFSQVLFESKFPIDKSYITNVFKCSTVENSKFDFEEVKTCINAWLCQEIAYCSPRLIICLGSEAYGILDEVKLPVSSLIKIKKVFHPSYIARRKDKYLEWKEQWDHLVRVI